MKLPAFLETVERFSEFSGRVRRHPDSVLTDLHILQYGFPYEDDTHHTRQYFQAA